MPTIVSCTRKISGDSVRYSSSETGKAIEASEQYEIVLDSYATGVWVAKNAPIPQEGDPHPDNQLLTATGEPTIENVDGSPIRFMASVTFRTSNPSSNGGAGDKDSQGAPRRNEEPYTYSWQAVQSQEPIDQDALGDAICTVLGEQFDPPIVEDVYDAMFHEEFNSDDFNEQSYMEKIGLTNSQLWHGFQPGQARFTNYTANRLENDQGKRYWRIMHEVTVRKVPANFNPADVWKRRIRAEGYIARLTANGEKTNKDSKGDERTVPTLHDKTTGVVIDDPAQAQWYFFQTLPSFDFADLNIG